MVVVTDQYGRIISGGGDPNYVDPNYVSPFGRSSPPPAPAPAPTSGGDQPAVTYADLVDVNGTIYNKNTGEAYGANQTPQEAQAQLALDLGLANSSLIVWKNITPASSPPGSSPISPATEGTEAQFQEEFAGLYQDPSGTVWQIGSGQRKGITSAQALGEWFPGQPIQPISMEQLSTLPIVGYLNAGRVESAAPPEPSTDVPQDILDDPEFQQLPQDLQEFVIEYVGLIDSSNLEAIQRLAEVLRVATEQADPYFAEIGRIAIDQLERSTQSIEVDFGTQQEDLKKRIQRIAEDLQDRRGDLDIDEAAALARLKRQYESELEQLTADVEARGFSSSTVRTRAEDRLATERQDVATSTAQRFARAERDAELSSARGTQDTRTALERLSASRETSLTDLARRGESVLGTEGLQGLLAGRGLGGVRGTLEEEKQKDILARAQSLLALTNPI